MPFKSILVASDCGHPASSALDWTVGFAHALGARILVVHVYGLPLVGLPDATLMVNAETAARLSNEAQAALDAEVARVQGRGVVIAGILREGDPRDEVPALAASEGVDLIVVGSHGRRGVARALLGSVAEDLVRRSSIPVLVVRLG
jgi:nucleotide-binding universal stress UspA family protein